VCVAISSHDQIRAHSTSDSGLATEAKRVVESTVVTVDGFHSDRASARLTAGAAGQRATAVRSPLAYFAVNGARTVVTVNDFGG